MASMLASLFPTPRRLGSDAPSCDGQLLKAATLPSTPSAALPRAVTIPDDRASRPAFFFWVAFAGLASTRYHRRRQLRGRARNGQNGTQDALRQDLRRPRRLAAAGRHVHPLCRPPPRARGDEPAGVRGPEAGEAQGARAREDAGRGRPQHRHLPRPPPGHQGRGKPHPGRDHGQERQGLRRRVLQRERRAAGHRARDRA